MKPHIPAKIVCELLMIMKKVDPARYEQVRKISVVKIREQLENFVLGKWIEG